MKKWLILLLLSYTFVAEAQSKYPMDSLLFTKYQYRNIGPFRGGRASGVCGDYKNKQVFYMGATGGGVWQTKDGGSNWSNISDKYFGGSIGAVEVCATDPLLIYVGMGENTMRGNVSEGRGMWKSTDGGKHWQFVGLDDTRHITKIFFHPKNPEIVYCTATGHLFGPNEERGVYKTSNGGLTWKKILFINDEVGAIDMAMDATNPDILYVSSWRVKRTPYSMESGGEGSGIWKSTDGGNTWKNISTNKGFPKDTLGNIGIAIAPSNTEKLYAIVESKSGGLYVSNDAGDTWMKQNDESKIRQRGWYFNKVFVDPKNENIVYICNVSFYKSTDGGKTFQTIHTPHGDHHNLWIDPEDGQRMIIADDGGAQISFDGGGHWSTYHNQPTAQFYRVTTDNHFPYRVLGCQQDNSSVRILSRTYHGSIGNQDWGSSAGFESGHIVADPTNDEIVYGGNYGGYLSRLNHKTNENRTISVYPVSPIGEGADSLKYRFQWNFPIFFSPHNPKRLYAAGNQLFMTENEGQSWTAISPDLTTNDKSKQQASGGVITKDNTSVEYYCTIFAAVESPVEKDLIWCGSDDGLVHVTRDGGKNWQNVTPNKMPEYTMINCIEADPFDGGTCYIVGTRYKLDDEHPYIYKTNNYGRTWQKITTGIPDHHFTRCLRADPVVKGILYAGTEQGMYISLNDGENWEPFQLNLPIVPITDLAIKENDLIVATQGRSFWILDDLTFIHQLKKDPLHQAFHVFNPRVSYSTNGYQNKQVRNEGMNPPNGVVFHYWVKPWDDTSTLQIQLLDANQKTLRTYSNKSKDKEDQISVESGMNQFVWNMQVKGVDKIDDMIMWNGNVGEYKVPPGKYTAIFKRSNDSVSIPFEIRKDPNYAASENDYQAQFDFLNIIKNKFEETQQTIKDIRTTRAQINTLKDRLGNDYPATLDSLGKKILNKIAVIEGNLYQTKAKSEQDVLNYPIKLNDKLVGIFDAVNQHTAPTTQSRVAYQDIAHLIDLEIEQFKTLYQNEIKQYNALVHEKNIDFIMLKKQ
ncbi:MAG: glycosyl hydrolase [Bacteroidetes bacterium]|nr:glycosyl hydrolase [Bacteroidota bacterium]